MSWMKNTDLFKRPNPVNDREDESQVIPPTEQPFPTEPPSTFDRLDGTSLPSATNRIQRAPLPDISDREHHSRFEPPGHDLRNNGESSDVFTSNASNARSPRSGLPSPITTPDTSPNALNDASNGSLPIPSWNHYRHPNGVPQFYSLEESTTSRMVNGRANHQESSYYSTRHSTLRASWPSNDAGGSFYPANRSGLDRVEDILRNPATIGPHPTNNSEPRCYEEPINRMPSIENEHTRTYESMGSPMMPWANGFQEHLLPPDNSFLSEPAYSDRIDDHSMEWNPLAAQNSGSFESRPPIDYGAPYTAPNGLRDMTSHSNDMRSSTWPQPNQRHIARRQGSAPNVFGNDFTNRGLENFAASHHPLPQYHDPHSMLDDESSGTTQLGNTYAEIPYDHPDPSPSDDFLPSLSTPLPDPDLALALARRRSARHRPRHRSMIHDDPPAVGEERESPTPDANKQPKSPEEANPPSSRASPAPRSRKGKGEDPQIPRWAVAVPPPRSLGGQRGITGVKQPFVRESELRRIREGYYQRPPVFLKHDPNGTLNLRRRVRITLEEKEALKKLRPSGWDIKKGPSKHIQSKEELELVNRRYGERLKQRAANKKPEDKKRKIDEVDESGDSEQSRKRSTQKGKQVQYEAEKDKENEEEESEYQEDDDDQAEYDSDDLYDA